MLTKHPKILYHQFNKLNFQGTEGTYRSMDQMHIPRRGSNQTPPLTRFRIWLSVIKFELSPKFGTTVDAALAAPIEDCNGMLRIWDGPLREAPNCKDLNCENNKQMLGKYRQNYTNVIARFCRGTIPRSCDHGILNKTKSRPCAMSESYLSSSDYVTLELRNTESTALRPLGFKIRYEFVDLLQDGMPFDGASDYDCSRKFVSTQIERKEPGIVRSVRNIFLFGRGGATNVKCIYRFEAQRGESIRIILKKVMSGNRTCASKIDSDINRSYCFGDTSVKVEIFERPWQDSILFPRGCICNSRNSSELPVIYTSTSREVEIHFTAINMTSLDDPDTVNFEGTYEFLHAPTTCKDSRRKSGTSGIVDMTIGDMVCRTRPWLIEPLEDKSLYIRLKGFYLRRYNPLTYLPFNTSIHSSAPMKCETKARVVLTTGEGVSITACPLGQDAARKHVVEVYSSGWNSKIDFQAKFASKVVSVEFLEPEDGDYSFTWLELTRKPPQGLFGRFFLN